MSINDYPQTGGPGLTPTQVQSTPEALVGTISYVETPRPNFPTSWIPLDGQLGTGHVATYPVLATRYPSWVVGADIQYPDRNTAVGGRFLRGGNDADVGTERTDTTAPNSLSVRYTRYASIPNNSSIGGSNGRWRGTTTSTATVTGDAETAPVHASGVWVVVV